MFVAFYMLALTMWLPGLGSVRLLEIQVPPRVQAGETVHLACSYDLEGAPLYSVNWWRGSEQFYQFSPHTPRHVTVYTTPGIKVDVKVSDGNVVVLRNVSHTSAGKYTCEVLTDYPSFEKDTKYSYMEVIDIPKRNPEIFLRSRQWSPGEILEANCTSPGAQPPPQLHWYINGAEISPKHPGLVRLDSEKYLPLRMKGVSDSIGEAGEGVVAEVKEPESDSSPRISELKMWLNSTYFHQPRQATLTCEASLPGLYRRSADVFLSLPGYRDAAPSQAHRARNDFVKVAVSLVVIEILIM